MNIVISIMLIAIGVIIIIINRDDLLTFWGIIGIILFCTILYEFLISDYDFTYLSEKLFSDNSQYILEEENSYEKVLADFRLGILRNIKKLMPFILSILTIILGMMIDLFKAINDFINDILIEWIKKSVQKIYDKRYISYLTVSTKGLGDIILKEDNKKNIVMMDEKVIDIAVDDHVLHIIGIKYDATKGTDLLAEMFDYIFYNCTELYQKWLCEFKSSDDNFDLEEWADWIGIDCLDMIICFDNMILKSRCFTDKCITLKINWETKEFIKT